MRLVFMGTASFAVPSLRLLLMAGHDIAAVVTQPDRKRGRGNRVMEGPVKELAREFGIDVLQPPRIKDPEAVEMLKHLSPDLIIVVAYGQILPPAVLEIPPRGCINVHGSLLPRYRGAAPVQRAIMAGEKVSGVTTMYMDRGLDTGDIILSKEVILPEEADGGQIYDLLAREGAALLLETVEQVEWGSAPRRPQDHEQASYAPPLTRADEVIDFTRSAQEIRNQVRALSPQPGATAFLNGSPLKVYEAQVVECGPPEGQPGQILLSCRQQGIVVQTGQGQLRLSSLQRPGKKRVTDLEFICGSGDLTRCFFQKPE